MSIVKIIILFITVCVIFCETSHKNDECIVNEQKGRCLLIDLCPLAINVIKKGIHPKICSFEGLKPIICCLNQYDGLPNQNEDFLSQNETYIKQESQWNQNVSSVIQNGEHLTQNGLQPTQNVGQLTQNGAMLIQNSEQSTQHGEHLAQNGGQLIKNHSRLHDEKCKEFLDEIKTQNFEKSNNSVRASVIEDTIAKIGEFPHMALLGYGDKNDIHWNCAGSLISKSYILSSALCLSHLTFGEVKYVQLGDVRFDGSSKSALQFQVIERINHPEYTKPLIYNDIALLKLNKEVLFNEAVKPACLYSDDNVADLLDVTSIGWGLEMGLSDLGRIRQDILQKIDLDIFSYQECSKIQYYQENKRQVPSGVLNEKQICAGQRERIQELCQGDSGAPLQWKNNDWNDLYKIIGITSFSKGCLYDGVPAIYTRVAHYIPWIESIVFS